MISFQNVTISYPRALEPTLRGVNLEIEEGAFALVTGPTGSGKTTFLSAISGLVPHFTGGHLAGQVRVAGRSTADHPPRDLADVVGYVSQDPRAGFVTDTVEEELAFAMEQLAVPPDVMRKRVEETLDLLGIAELRDRPLSTLSGGQAQRVAIGSVLTAGPRILVLDEPTSALDPTAAEEVLATLVRLVHDLGITAVVAEHRLERIIQFADEIITVQDGEVTVGSPGDQLANSPLAPPIIQLGKRAGWTPLPLSIRDARRAAKQLRSQLMTARPADTRAEDSPGAASDAAANSAGPQSQPRPWGEVVLQGRDVVVNYPQTRAVRGVNTDLHFGEITALMGRNGSGKSSLLWAWQGSGRRTGGIVQVGGQDTKKLAPAAARAVVGLVPQTPGDLLYYETVATECDQADRDADAPAGTCLNLLCQFTPGIDPANHPRDLSEGQRLSLVLAIQLTARPRVLLLDEPTRGLDLPAKNTLIAILRSIADDGTAVVLATHDVEVVARVADRVVVMAEGEIVADGPAPAVIGASPAFAPQIAKIIGPQWLTVEQVYTHLEPATVSGKEGA